MDSFYTGFEIIDHRRHDDEADYEIFPAAPAKIQQIALDGAQQHDFKICANQHDDAKLRALIQAAWSLAVSCQMASQKIIFDTYLSSTGAQQGQNSDEAPPAPIKTLTVDATKSQKTIDFLASLQNSNTNGPWQKSSAAQRSRTLLWIHPAGVGDSAAERDGAETIPPEGLTEYAFIIDAELKSDAVVSLKARFDSKFVDGWVVSTLLRRLEFVLQQLIGIPETDSSTLDTISMLSSHDLDLIWKWNSDVPGAVSQCVQDLVDNHAAARPEAVAVHSREGQLTYSELCNLATAFAHQIQPYITKAGLIVPICVDKTLWAVVAQLGILKAGGGLMLLNPGLPEERLREMINQNGADFIVAMPSSLEISKKLCPRVVTLQQGNLNMPGSAVAATASNSHPEPSQTMYRVFTSGSTGRPKCVSISHENFCSAIHHQAARLRLSRRSRLFDFASYEFDVAVFNTFAALAIGACVCVPPDGVDSKIVATTMEEMRANIVILTPTMARALDPATVPTLETMVFLGETFTIAEAQRWKDKTFVNSYGPTECTSISTVNSGFSNFDDATRLGTGAGATTWVVDIDNHDILAPPSCLGELLLEGPIVGNGYLNDAAKTAAAYIQDPVWLLQGSCTHPGRRGTLYKTGDLVQYSVDGTLTFISRKGSQVKICGHRVELGEVAATLQACFAGASHIVADIISKDDDGGPPELAAFIRMEESSNGATITEMSLPRTVRDKLAQYLEEPMVPTRFFSVREFPLTGTGKTSSKRLRELAQSCI